MFSSCTNKSHDNCQNWSESQKRKYFQDSIAYRYSSGKVNSPKKLWNFTVFMDSLYHEIKAKNKYNPLVYAFEETYIDTSKIDSSKYWIRMIIDPCWRIPFCITLEKKNDRTYITSKITNGQGGYYSGVLLYSCTKIYSDTLYNSISKELHNLNFWNLGIEESSCIDGETWYFEAIESGQYNYISRRCFRLRDKPASRQNLYQFGIKLLRLGNFFDENYIESGPMECDLTFLKSAVDTANFKVKMIQYIKW